MEKAVYSANGGANAGYKSKIRSLFVNLKDKSNPNLRASIVDGSLAPERFTEMSSQVRVPPSFILRLDVVWTDEQHAGHGLRGTQGRGQEDPGRELLQVAVGGGEAGGDGRVPVFAVQAAQVPLPPAADAERGRADDCTSFLPFPPPPIFFCPFFCIPFGENNANDIIFISDIRHVRTSLSTPLRAMYSLSLLLTTAAQFAKTSTSYFILTQGHHLTLTILQVEILIGSPSHPSHSRRRPLLPVVCSASSLFYTCPSALFNTWLLPLYAPHRTNKPPVLPISFHPPAA